MFSRKGFTLLELLIVIAVIAILVGIALPKFKGMHDEGNIAKAKGELRTLQTAVESYIMHNNNTLPAALSNLTTAIPNIIKILPKDPFVAGGATDYVYNPGTYYYAIYSVGPTADGSAGVPDAVTGISVVAGNCVYVTNGSGSKASL
ncbi:MAG: prepilin-type N-terminal cleavage/methylation domain-containing protein [Candidatus Omnitrophota bacterium]|nr:prepilin-type N-terminal cleavage/methylation domain-containing protein [Candidatus Omnitrophota bacterium]